MKCFWKFKKFFFSEVSEAKCSKTFLADNGHEVLWEIILKNIYGFTADTNMVVKIFQVPDSIKWP